MDFLSKLSPEMQEAIRPKDGMVCRDYDGDVCVFKNREWFKIKNDELAVCPLSLDGLQL
jgi:hypothetical protein